MFGMSGPSPRRKKEFDRGLFACLAERVGWIVGRVSE